MRSCFLAAVILAAPFTAARAADSAPGRKIQKVAVANLAPESTRAAAVESSIREDLLKKRVMADSLRTLTAGDKKPASVHALVKLIQSQGYDSLLCVGARKTIQVSPPDNSNDFATMESCLSIFLTGKYPSGMALQSQPFIVDAQPSQMPQAGNEYASQRTPIAANPAAAPVTYYKRTLRLFDIPKQTLFWEKKIMVKMPTDLQESLQATRIANETTKTLEESGLLP